MNKLIFGLRLKTVLKYQGWNQTEFAKAIKVTPSTINKYVRGSVLPTLETFKKIVEVTNVSAEWYLGIELPEEIPRNKQEVLDGKTEYGQSSESLSV